MLPLTHILLGLLLGATQSAPSAPAPRLELRVFEADCSPARVNANRLWEWNPSARVLYCVRCPAGETPNPESHTPEGAGTTPPGRADTSFFVEPGERYVYGCIGRDIQPIEGEVTIGIGTPLTVRELHLQPVAKTQLLEIHLLRPDWNPIRHDVQVSIESLVTGLTLFRYEMSPHDLQFEKPLPVGRYRVRVETEENGLWDCGQGPPQKPAPFGDWVETVELGDGDPVQIESFFWSGGKLRLALEVPPWMDMDKLWREQFPTRFEPPAFGWLRLGTRGPGARVTLRPDPAAPVVSGERGMPQIAGMVVHFFGPKFDASNQFDALLPGDEETSADWIPPGAYIARIEARDFVPVEVQVVIRKDETTELRVRLAPL